MISPPLFAQTVPAAINISGGLFNPNGTAIVQSGVSFKLEVYDAGATCVLYSEEHLSQDLSSSKGAFSLQLGGGSSAVNNMGGSGFTSSIFLNGLTKTPTGCGSAITFNAGDVRLVRVYYNLGSGYVAMSPDVPIVSSAYAMIADTLQGHPASDFLLSNVNSDLQQANLENVFSNVNYPKLSALLNGTSTQYISSSPSSAVNFNSQQLTGIADPTAAQDAATKNYVDTTVGGKLVDDSTVGAGTGGGETLVWDQAQNKWVAEYLPSSLTGLVAGTGLTGGTITSFGTISVDVGTTANKIVQLTNTGVLPAVDGSLLTNLQFPVTSVAGRTGAVTLSAADIAGLGTAATKDAGLNAGNVLLLTTNNSLPALNASSLTNVNATFLQSRAVASLAPSSGQVLTWNVTNSDWEPQAIPVNAITELYGDVVASGLGDVNATIPANTITSSKINNSGNSANRILITDGVSGSTVTYATCAQGEILRYDTTTGWGCASSTSGSVTSIVSGTGLTPNTITSAGTINVDTGTTANKILQLNGSAQIPAVDGSLLSNVNATKLQSQNVAATVPSGGQVLTWNTTDSAWEPLAVTAAANAFVNGGNSFGTATSLGTNDAQSLGLRTNNAVHVTIDTLGNVGVGTTSPVGNLNVVGQGSGSNLILDRYGSTPILTFRHANGTAASPTASASGDPIMLLGARGYTGSGFVTIPRAQISAYAAETWTPTANGTYMALFTTPTGSSSMAERVRIDSQGNVGVGTSSPLAVLDVYGTGSLQSAILVPRDSTTNRPSGVNGMIRYNTNTNKFEVFENGAWGNMTSSGASGFVNGGNSFGSNATVGTNDAKSLGLKTNNTTQIMIDQYGNVGIGTASPTEHVQVDMIDTSAYASSSAAQNWPWTSGVGSVLSIYNHGTADGEGSYLALQAKNAAGIANTAYIGVVTNSGSSGYAPEIVIGQRNGGPGYTERMRISANGYVGIGTTAPTYLTDVRSSATASQFHVSGAANDTGFYVQAAAGGSSNLSTGAAYDGSSWKAKNTGATIIAQSVATGFTFQTNSGLTVGNTFTPTARVVIDMNGNVGIGTASPTAALDVNGAGTMSAITVPRDTTANRPTGVNGMIRYNTNNNKFEAFQNGGWTNMVSSGASSAGTAGAIQYSDGASAFVANNNVVIDGTNGRIGVGTASPGQKLSVNGRIETDGGMFFNQGSGATDNLIYLGSTSSGAVDASIGMFAGGIGSANSTDGAYWLARGNNFSAISSQRGSMFFSAGNPSSPVAGEGRISFRTANDQTRMVIDDNGYVGIGIGNGSPNVAFDVEVGGNKARISDTASGIITPLEVASSASAANGNGSGLLFTAASSLTAWEDVAQISGVVTDSTHSTFSGDLLLHTSYNDTLNERMRITSRGLVGIGTTSPKAMLDVNGTGTFSALIVPRDTTSNRPGGVNGMIRYNTNTGAFEGYQAGSWSTLGGGVSSQWTTTGTDIYYLLGNVGIGTTTATGFGVGWPILELRGTATTVPEITLDGTPAGGDKFVLVSDNPSQLYFRDVTSGATVLQMDSFSTTIPFLFATTGVFGTNTSGGNLTIDSTYQSTKGSIFIAPSGGKVGIGTTSPQATLDVVGNFKTSGQMRTGSQVISGGTNAIDWNNGNTIRTDYNCASAFTFANLQDGATYTLIVTDASTTQCTFSTTTTGTDAATVTYRFLPANGVRTTSTYTVYTFLRSGTVVLVNWQTGY